MVEAAAHRHVGAAFYGIGAHQGHFDRIYVINHLSLGAGVAVQAVIAATCCGANFKSLGIRSLDVHIIHSAIHDN